MSKVQTYFPFPDGEGHEGWPSAYVAAADFEHMESLFEAARSENLQLRGLLDGIELIALNDKSGCHSCTAVVNAIVTELREFQRQLAT